MSALPNVIRILPLAPGGERYVKTAGGWWVTYPPNTSNRVEGAWYYLPLHLAFRRLGMRSPYL